MANQNRVCNWKSKHLRDTKTNLIIKFSRLPHDVVTCDVDRDVSTAYCILLVFKREYFIMIALHHDE